MFYFGKFLLKYLRTEKYKYHANVLESHILDPDTALQLYFEKSDRLVYTMNLFFNPNINIEFIKANAQKEYLFLDFEKISYSGLLKSEDIIQNPSYKWNYHNLILNKNLNPLVIVKFFSTKYRNQDIFENIFFNKSSNLHMIRQLEKNFRYKNLIPGLFLWLLKNDETSLQDFESIKTLFGDKDIYSFLSSNINLTLEFVIKNLQKQWDWKLLSTNPAFSIHQIMHTLQLPWNFNLVSIHPRLTIHDVLKYNFVAWNYENLCVNKNITIFDLEKLPHEIFGNMFAKKYIFLNEHWDEYYFEKYHKIYNFSEECINTMFLAKKAWLKKISFKRKEVNTIYDELMNRTWHPSRLVNWIWDTDQVKEWNSMDE